MLLKGYMWLVFFSKRKFQTKRIKRHVNGLGKQVKTHFSQLVYEDEGTWYTENLKQLSFSLIWSLLRQGSYRVKRRKLGKGEKEKKTLQKRSRTPYGRLVWRWILFSIQKLLQYSKSSQSVKIPRDGEANSLVERILCSRKPENPYLPQSTHF